MQQGLVWEVRTYFFQHMAIMAYDQGNPALGQCYPTSWVVQQFFPKTEILMGKVWNGLLVNGVLYHIDLSWQQFPMGSSVREFQILDRRSLNVSQGTIERCEILLQRVIQYLENHHVTNHIGSRALLPNSGSLRYDSCIVKSTTATSNFFVTHYRVLIVAAILMMALFLRAWKIDYIPFQSDGDELAYVFAGQSLIEKHMPISWSSFTYPASYNYQKITLGDANFNAIDTFQFIKPWFDHPFVLPLMIGGWTEAFGYHFPSVPPSSILRWPMLVFAGITLYLVFALAKEWFGYWSGVFSLFLMSFSPVFIFGQRMVVGENLLVPFLLLAIYFAVKKRSVVGPVIFSVLAALSKFTGVIAIPIMLIYYLVHKQYKTALIYTVSSLGLFALLYGGYGALLGWSQFLAAFGYQSHRLLGWSNPAFILANPGFHHFVVFDMSYYVILLLGIAPLVLQRAKFEKKHIFLLLTTFILFITIWATSAEQDMLGWYKLPFFTLLTIAAGQVIVDATMPAGVLMLLWVTVVNNFGLVRYPTHPLPEGLTLRAVLGGIFGVTGLGILFADQKFGKWLVKICIVLVMVAYIGSSFYITNYYYQAFCRDRHCPVPFMTLKQVLQRVR